MEMVRYILKKTKGLPANMQKLHVDRKKNRIITVSLAISTPISENIP
jgi:hypothetical protein